jgi:hypothetical protein
VVALRRQISTHAKLPQRYLANLKNSGERWHTLTKLDAPFRIVRAFGGAWSFLKLDFFTELDYGLACSA